MPRVRRRAVEEDPDGPCLLPPQSYPQHSENTTNGSMPVGGPPTGESTVRWAPDRLDGPSHDDPPTQSSRLTSRTSSRPRCRCSVTRSPHRRRRTRHHRRLPRSRRSTGIWTRRPSGCRFTKQCCPSGSRKATARSATPPASVAGRPRPSSARRAARAACRSIQAGRTATGTTVHAEATNGNTPHVEYADHAEPAAAEPEPEPLPEPEPVEEPSRASAWQSPGDEGWQAAQALTKKKAPAVTTSAGLPKRVPKAQLIPGSAPSRPTSPQQQAQRSPALPPRSADAVRGRMSSFQQGIRRGRHALVDTYAGDQDSVESRQDEEQE